MRRQARHGRESEHPVITDGSCERRPVPRGMLSEYWIIRFRGCDACLCGKGRSPHGAQRNAGAVLFSAMPQDKIKSPLCGIFGHDVTLPPVHPDAMTKFLAKPPFPHHSRRNRTYPQAPGNATSAITFITAGCSLVAPFAGCVLCSAASADKPNDRKPLSSVVLIRCNAVSSPMRSRATRYRIAETFSPFSDDRGQEIKYRATCIEQSPECFAKRC
jgi:hypothetical protein